MNAMPISNVTCAYLKKSNETLPVEPSLKDNDRIAGSQISFKGKFSGFLEKILGGFFRFLGKVYGRMFKAPAAVKEEGSHVADIVEEKLSQSMASQESLFRKNSEHENIIEKTIEKNLGEINLFKNDSETIQKDGKEFEVSFDFPPPMASSTGNKIPLTVLKRDDLAANHITSSTNNLSENEIIEYLQNIKDGTTFVKIDNGGFRQLTKTDKYKSQDFSEMIIKQQGVSSIAGFETGIVRDFLNKTSYPNLKKVTLVLGEKDGFQVLSLPSNLEHKEDAFNFVEQNKHNFTLGEKYAGDIILDENSSIPSEKEMLIDMFNNSKALVNHTSKELNMPEFSLVEYANAT
jgi:hypothetical protein